MGTLAYRGVMPTNLDLSAPIQGKIWAALKADAGLIAIVPAGSIYPQTVPASAAYPFIKLGETITTPQFIDGNDGSSLSAAVHVFTKLKKGSVPDPRLQAQQVNAEVVRVLNAMEGIDIGDGLTLDVFPRLAQVMQDGDADAYHGFVTFDAIAS